MSDSPVGTYSRRGMKWLRFVLRKGKQTLKAALVGEARDEAFRKLMERVQRTARQAEGVPEEEIEAAIDEAVNYVRHNRR